MSSSFGTILKVTTFGESHSSGVGAILDGCPPGIAISEKDIQKQLDRRRPGQSNLSTSRNEKDQISLLSGVENGFTLGTPIAMVVINKDHNPADYKDFRSVPRPSHADYTYQMKYGLRSASGGGRASARETIGRVAAGAIAEKILADANLADDRGIEIIAWVSAVGKIQCPLIDMDLITRSKVDKTAVRCPHLKTAQKMITLIENIKKEADSIGGVISCVCRNVPIGLGEPVFDKLEAKLAQAMLSIPATKGFEIGSGFKGSQMSGSRHNDLFIKKKDRLGTITNNSGGIQGGISNGEPIFFKIAFKPTATIGKAQKTVDFNGSPVELVGKGRHDPCVVPRAVPIVEAMTALVLGDFLLRQRAIIIKNC